MNSLHADGSRRLQVASLVPVACQAESAIDEQARKSRSGGRPVIACTVCSGRAGRSPVGPVSLLAWPFDINDEERSSDE